MTVDRGPGSGGGTSSESFDAVVVGAYRSLARLAYVMSGDEATAEDIVAEAFARSWVPWKDGKVEELGPYVRRTVVNLGLQGQHRRRLEARALERFRHRPRNTADESGDGVVHLVDLRQALRGLSMEHRAIIGLRFLADLSEQETAEVLQLPVGTVKSRTSRALKALRPAIEGTPHG